MNPSGMMPALLAAKIICCFGISSVSSVGSMPVSSAKSSPPIFIAASRGLARGDGGHAEERRRRLDHGNQPNASHVQAALRFQLRNDLVNLTDVVRTLGFGHGHAVDVRANAGVEVLDGHVHGAVDAYDDVGTALTHAPRGFRDEQSGGILLGGGHAVLQVELNAVGAAGVRLLDEPLLVDGDVEQRSPDRQIWFQHARTISYRRMIMQPAPRHSPGCDHRE